MRNENQNSLDVADESPRPAQVTRVEDDTIHGCGRVFDEGVARGAYTDARGIVIVQFLSSEDNGYITMFKLAPGLSTFGETREESLREFALMLPAAIESGVKVEEIDYPYYTRTPSGLSAEEIEALRAEIRTKLRARKADTGNVS